MAEDQATKLAHFQEVTGMVDPDQCQNILNAHNWNLETAVQDALAIQEGGQPMFTPPTLPPRPQEPPVQLIRASPTAMRRQGWWEWLMGWAFFPIRLVVSTITELTQLILNIFLGNRMPISAQDPRGDVLNFITQFESEYGLTHPQFLDCSYGEALEKSKTDLQFLIVYLHSAGHQDTPQFCHEVLTNELFIKTLTENNCLIFGVSIDSEEGTRVSYILRETTYPFMALIMLRGSRMTVVGRLEGYISLNDMIDKLQQLFTSNEPELVVLRTERMQRSLDQQIRKEQEEEYLKSLQADQEKVRKKEEEEQRALEAAEQEKMKEQRKREEIEAFEQEKVLRFSRLPPEPSSDDPSAIHINIKLPNGQRFSRRFNTFDTLESVYDFAYSCDDIPLKFILVINYPRQELNCNENGGPSLAELQLNKKCLLFVQDNT